MGALHGTLDERIRVRPGACARPARHRLQHVERGLAACVNLLPGVRSVYRWQGEVCEDGETLLIAKTSAAGFAALRAAVLQRHPYELPEIVAVKLDDAHPPYLQWLLSQVSDSPSP